MALKDEIADILYPVIEIQNNIKTQQDLLKTTAKSVFQNGCKLLFETFPDLHGFGWSQYTPHFNDGDACIFDAHVEDASVLLSKEIVPVGDGGDEYNEYEQFSEDIKNDQTWYRPAWHIKDTNGRHDEIGFTVREFLKAFDRDVYLDMFDDHSVVFVSRDGIKTEFLDHD